MKGPAPSSEAAPAQVDARLRVVTWNVGEVYWPWQGNQLKDRDVGAVRETLAALDPDVVLLQELAHRGQLEALCAGVYAGEMPAGCGYDRHVAVLARRDLSPRFTEHVLAPTRRGVVGAHFRVAGVAVRAFSLHFDVFRPERRLLQARAAAELVGDPGELTVAGGDLNYDPVAAARLGRAEDTATEATLAARLRDVAAATGPTLVGLLRVDRLFAGGRALRGSQARAAEHALPLGDHAPIVCDLRLVSSTNAVDAP